jgi:hypothetical protein
VESAKDRIIQFFQSKSPLVYTYERGEQFPVTYQRAA